LLSPAPHQATTTSLCPLRSFPSECYLLHVPFSPASPPRQAFAPAAAAVACCLKKRSRSDCSLLVGCFVHCCTFAFLHSCYSTPRCGLHARGRSGRPDLLALNCTCPMTRPKFASGLRRRCHDDW
jgi:hypothetical protein